MNYIIAIIRPSKLDDVRDALTSVGIDGMTVSEVKGYGRQKGQTEIYRGAEYTVSLVPKLKVEIAVASGVTEKAVEAICTASRTDKIGDGKIFVFGLQDAMRIRTGERGESAL
jgi:nitrogen regulatory protein P-II 2